MTSNRFDRHKGIRQGVHDPGDPEPAPTDLQGVLVTASTTSSIAASTGETDHVDVVPFVGFVVVEKVIVDGNGAPPLWCLLVCRIQLRTGVNGFLL